MYDNTKYPQWYHGNCFLSAVSRSPPINESCFYGFDKLQEDGKTAVRSVISKLTTVNPRVLQNIGNVTFDSLGIKEEQQADGSENLDSNMQTLMIEDEVKPEYLAYRQRITHQNKRRLCIFAALTKIKNNTKAQWTEQTLCHNGFDIPKSKILPENLRFFEVLLDFAEFGVPSVCPKCRQRNPEITSKTVFYNPRTRRYECLNAVSGNSRCFFSGLQGITLEPLLIPQFLLEKFPYLTVVHNQQPPERCLPMEFELQDAYYLICPDDLYKQAEDKDKIYKNGYAVNPFCEDHAQTHIHIEQDVVYSTLLRKTILRENLNSSYVLQLVKHDKKDKYMVFRAWARNGTTQGGCSTKDFGQNLAGAKQLFMKLFKAKTGHYFQQTSMDIYNKRSNVTLQSMGSVDDFIELIYQFPQTVKMEWKLQDINETAVQAALHILLELQKAYENGENPTLEFLEDRSNTFYKHIPHDSYFNPPQTLSTLSHVNAKRNMLTSVILHKLDECFQKVKPEVLVQELPKIEEHTTIAEFIETTKSTYGCDILSIHRIHREADNDSFNLGNLHLLWHGTKTNRIEGILKEGLLIDPPHRTGKTFGNGIYFADMLCKAIQYCYNDGVERDQYLLILGEVAMGKIDERDYRPEGFGKDKLKRGADSFKYIGENFTNPYEHVVLGNATVPLGTPKKRVSSSYQGENTFNEHVVYEKEQVKIRYVVRVFCKPDVIDKPVLI
ncbi:hypothetical protein L596_009948 [Steinernema carpocapsae]|uniref:Poly [ADP-ribose] polymerase n=1 Tax=Steinernema carpocapsae TaxID=34508 RepID=A0A4U5PHC1_STECR|nr:hypothetical protein L596_009948 [Steinernema carpocapsae]